MDCPLTLRPTRISKPTVSVCPHCGNDYAGPLQAQAHEKNCPENAGTQGSGNKDDVGGSEGNKGDVGGSE